MSEIQKPVKSVVYMDDSVSNALHKIEKGRDPRVLVVDPKSNKLVGIVSPIDVVRLNSSDLAEM